MNTPVRDEWIAMLESVTQGSPDAVSSEWTWILDGLKLPLDLFPYVSQAIQQGRWKTANNPKSYVRKVAWRRAAKAEREFEDSNPLKPVALPADGSLSMEDALEHFGHLSDTAEAIQSPDGVWRRPGILRYYVDEDQYESVTDRLLSKIPQSAKQLVESSDEYKAAIEQFNNSTMENHIEERAAGRGAGERDGPAAFLGEVMRMLQAISFSAFGSTSA